MYDHRVVVVFLAFVCLVSGRSFNIKTKDNHMAERKRALEIEANMRLGANQILSKKEKQVNDILLADKKAEFDVGRQMGAEFPPNMHFFKAKKRIDQSKVFHFIKEMPKGAVLHIHDSAMVSLEWLVKNVTYRENCYMCNDSNSGLQFKFSENTPVSPACNWSLVSERRNASTDPEDFDHWLYTQMSLLTDDPDRAYPTQDVVWREFFARFSVVGGLFYHAPIFKDYFYQALTELRDDNVQYVEVRIVPGKTYNIDGSENPLSWSFEAYHNVTQMFLEDNPGNFSGAKIIFTTIRFFNKSSIASSIADAVEFHKRNPDFFIGFDLVSQEDHGNSLLFYLDELMSPNMEDPSTLPYFFHAGETDWQGTPIDENIIDAILLGTKRIGHGYAISKHPWAMEQVKTKNIAIEVNPISNQVLGLVKDIRDHPAASLIAQNYPIVISCDDPPMWGGKGLSYDFYQAFMGMSGADAGLALLKQFALNSLEYSAMTDKEKKSAKELWEEKWETFLDNILNIPKSTDPTTSPTENGEMTTKKIGGATAPVVSFSLLWILLVLSVNI